MMRGERQPRRTGIVAFFVVLWSLLGIAFPLVYTFDDRRSAAVFASPRDMFAINEPVALGYGLTVERATLQLADRVAEGSTVEAILASGKATLVVDGGLIRFDARHASKAVDEYPAPMVAALIDGQVETIKLRRSRLMIVLGENRAETLTDVNAEIVNRRRNGLSMAGTADIRGQRHTIDVQLGAPPDRRMPTRVSIRGAVKGNLLNGTLDGRLAVGEPMNVQGLVDLSLPDLRLAARAFGLDVGDGPAVGGLKVKGRLDWNRTMIAFDRANFACEPGEATGTLALDLEQQRPTLTGTIAFRSLDLTRVSQSMTREQDGFDWADFARPRAFLPLASSIDVDVRLSAASVKIGLLDLGAAAATVNMKGGKLNAELAEFEFAGGKGTAQATADLTLPAPRFASRVKLAGLDAAKTTTYLWGTSTLSGSVSVQADVTAQATTGVGILNNAAGTIGVKLVDGGRLGLDLKSLFSAPVPPGAVWEHLTRSPTAIDTLDARLSIASGVVTAESAVVQSGELRYEASGRLDHASGKLDASIRMRREQKPGVPQLDDIVRLDGDAARPLVTREASPPYNSVPSRAAVPPEGKPRG